MRPLLLAITLCLLWQPFSAQAQGDDASSTAHFLKLYNGGDAAERTLLLLSIIGADSAFVTANAELKTSGREPLYCQPEHLSLTPEQTVDRVEKGVAENKELATVPVTVAMLETFKRTFPCDASR
jgi:hypothetical protein